MKMNLQATHLELTDAIRDYAEKKLGELDRFLPEGTHASVDVQLERTTNHHKKGEVFRAEANTSVPGGLLRAEAVHEDLYAAIDEVKDEMTAELRKYKDKARDLQRRGQRSIKKRMTLSPLAWRKDDIHDKNL